MNRGSVYYLVGTSKVPVISRMWDIELDYPIKYYIWNQRCLQKKGKPSFRYNTKIEGHIIEKRNLTRLKIINADMLIRDARKIFSNTCSCKFTFFFIEPLDKKYIVHQVYLSNEGKDPGLTDYESFPIDFVKKKH